MCQDIFEYMLNYFKYIAKPVVNREPRAITELNSSYLAIMLFNSDSSGSALAQQISNQLKMAAIWRSNEELAACKQGFMSFTPSQLRHFSTSKY